MPTGGVGSVRLAAPVPRLSETPGHIHHAGGEIGIDTIDVLRSYTDMTPQEIDALLDAGIVFDAAHARMRARTEPAQVAAQVDPT